MEANNMEAMREALEAVAENLAMHVRCGRFVAPGDHVSFPISEAEAYIRDIRAALAAPPRNCDRFQTASEVSAYWNSNVRTVPLPHDAYGMHIDGETYPTFLDWLMAPAKEGK